MDEKVSIEVQVYAGASAIVGARSVNMELPSPISVSRVRQELVERYPRLQALAQHSRWAVGTEFVEDHIQLTGNSVIAMIPPVSGG